MKLPGGDEGLGHATGQVYEFWQRCVAARSGGEPGRWPDLQAELQAQWKAPQRIAAELLVLATLTDMAEAVAAYDGCQGGAYRAAVFRYARDELGIDLSEITSQGNEI